MINYDKLIEAKKKRLNELRENKGYTSGSKWNNADEVIAAIDRKLAFLDEHKADRAKEMIEKATALGYKLTVKRITPKGVLAITAKRGTTNLYGFVDPIGKLMLNVAHKRNNYESFRSGVIANVLTINFMRKNMTTRDNYLAVVLGNK